MKPEAVGKYYDEWMEKYSATYGDVIQAYRPDNVNKLLDYLLESTGIRDNDRILDAGCGVGGPAIYFANQKKIYVEGITISAEQQKKAVQKIKEAGMEDKINIIQGDYHHLTSYYEGEIFNKVIFLESLGHADNPGIVVEEVFKLLKPEGVIYIKDFFFKNVRDVKIQGNIDKVIHSMNEHYCYKVLDLPDLIYNLRSVGFQIDFIKKFEFESDISVRAAFENASEINHYKGQKEFIPAEWLEIRCAKPHDLYY